MHQRGDGNKRQLFLDKKVAAQPIKFKYANINNWHRFPKQGSSYRICTTSCPSISILSVTNKRSNSHKRLTELFYSHVHGIRTYLISSGSPQRPNEESNKIVRDGTISDSTGFIKISVWEKHIEQIEEGGFYPITDYKLQYYYGKCLSTC